MHPFQFGAQLRHRIHRLWGIADHGHPGQHIVELLLRLMAQQHPAHRGRPRRKATADIQSMVIIRELEARAIYRISSPSRVAMEQDSLSISLRCRSTGCAERASGVEPAGRGPAPRIRGRSWKFLPSSAYTNPSLLRVYRQRRTAARGMPVF